MPLLDEHLTEEKPEESSGKKGLTELQQIIAGVVVMAIWAGINGACYFIGLNMLIGIVISFIFLVICAIALKLRDKGI